jgi:small subunit ribosomal protein S5
MEFKSRDKNIDKKMISLRRVAKVTKGGKRLRFSAMVVAGDHNGSVGVGLGRGIDTKSAVEISY